MSIKLLPVAVTILAATALAKPPIATVTTANPITVNNANLPTTGAQTAPLVNGDEVQTTTGSAVVTMNADQSQFTLARDSRIRVQQKVGCSIALLQGTVAYKSSAAGTRICAADRVVKAQPNTEGSITLNGNKVQVAAKDPATVDIGKQPGVIAAHPVATAVVAGGGAAAATTAWAATGKKDRSKNKKDKDK